MRIAFAGTPEFALPALRALAASRHQLVGVLAPPDRPRGRGRLVMPSAVKAAAAAYGLPISQPPDLASEERRRDLASWHADLLVVVAYGLILPREVLEIPRLGCLNIHASLLPRWRGAAPIERALLCGDDETGVTIMQMDAGLDTGPVLLQRRVPIARTDTARVLSERLSVVGAEALLEVIEAMAAGRAEPHPQAAEGATYASKIDKAEALIDWRRSALAIERQVRAFNPRPIAETRFAGEPLRVLSARAEGVAERATEGPKAPGPGGTTPPPSREPGTVVAMRRDALVVCCGEGLLAITELQRPGRNPVRAGDFANEGRLKPGQRLG